MTKNANNIDGREEASGVKRGKVDDEALYMPGRNDANVNAVNVNAANAVNAFNSNTDLKQRKKRTWKKPKDKPKRPLSAYNIFFQIQRERIVTGKEGGDSITPEEIEQSVSTMLKSKTRGPKRRQDRISHGQISFGDLARTIALKWKDIDPKIKAIFNYYAAQEKKRYRKEVVIWKNKKESEHSAKILARRNSLLNSSSMSSSRSTSLNDDSVRSRSSSVSTSMSTSLTSSFNPSDSISTSSHGSTSYTTARQVPNMNNAEPAQYHRSIVESDAGSGSGNSMTTGLLEKNDNTLISLRQQQRHLQQHHQQQRQDHHQQLLLQLQQQKIQHLQQLQQVRNRTSRMSNVRTTNMTFPFSDQVVMSSQPRQVAKLSSQSQSSQLLQSQSQRDRPLMIMMSSSSMDRQHQSDQYGQLEEITQKVDDLEKQQRRLQQQIKDHPHYSSNASLQLDDAMLGSGSNSSHSHHPRSSTTATAISTNNNNSEGFSASSNNNNNNNSSNFSAAAAALDTASSLHSFFDRDFESRQWMDGITPVSSGGGDGSTYLGRRRSSCPTTFYACRGGMGQQQQQYNANRRNSLFGPRDNIEMMYGANDFGHSSLRILPSSFHSVSTGGGGSSSEGQHQHQQQQQQQVNSRHNSLAALLRLQDNLGGGGGDEAQQQQKQKQDLQRLPMSCRDDSLTALLQLHDDNNIDAHGFGDEIAEGQQQQQQPSTSSRCDSPLPALLQVQDTLLTTAINATNCTASDDEINAMFTQHIIEDYI